LQINKASQAFYASGHWGLFFGITHAMIGRNILANHSLEMEKVPCFDLFGSKKTFLPVISLYTIHVTRHDLPKLAHNLLKKKTLDSGNAV